MYKEETRSTEFENDHRPVDLKERGRSIIFMLCFVPIFATIAFGGVDPWAVGAFALFSSLIVVFWLYDGLRNAEIPLSTNLLQAPMAALVVIGLVQLLPIGSEGVASGVPGIAASHTISLDPYATRIFLVRFAAYLVFFSAALTYVNGTSRIRKITVTIIIFGSAMAFFAILQRLANVENIYGVRPAPQAIPFGSFVNQHHFAALMQLLSGLTLGLLLGGGVKSDKKLLLGMAVAVMGGAAAFTGSRGGLLSFVAMIAFVTGASFIGRRSETARTEVRRRGLAAGAIGVSVFAALAGIAVLVGAGEGLVRGVGLGEGLEADITNGRRHFWSVALQIFRDHPIMGGGLEAFGVAFSRYDTWNGMFRVEQAHNDYLQMLADAGLLGFACVAGFIYFLIRQGASILRRTEDAFCRSVAVGSLAGCAGILVHSFFDFPLRTPANAYFFLLLIALAVAAGNCGKRGSSRRRRPSGH